MKNMYIVYSIYTYSKKGNSIHAILKKYKYQWKKSKRNFVQYTCENGTKEMFTKTVPTVSI